MQLPYRTDFPIFEHRERIVDALRSRRVLVLTGATGSGKTTQLPLLCLEAGRGTRARIGITQPRRIAAVSLAEFVAHQMGGMPGEVVGYKTRFGEKLSPRCCVKFMTDGILLAELQHDRLLKQYDTIIVDEAHERSLNIDVLIGYLRRLVVKRRDLTVIVSSATINADLFSRAFDHAPIIDVPGRLFPIEVLYQAPPQEDEEIPDYVDGAVSAVKEICAMGDDGDILVFMPTERDILETKDLLDDRRLGNVEILPLFSRLTHDQQVRIFRSSGRRRVVVSTNIAETSLTVPGIRYVVDTGMARVKRFSPSHRITHLPVEPVARSSADQRMGRCGRVAPGVCIRLYSSADYLSRPEFPQPEIQRCNLADVILKMASYGIGPVEEFPFIEMPSSRAVNDGYAHLRELGALTEENRLTENGRRMAQLPIDPHIAAMLLAARREHALPEATIIAAGISVVDPRDRPSAKRDEADLKHRRFVDASSDFLTLLRLWTAYHDEWDRLRTQNQMRKFCSEHFLSFTRMREWFDVHEQLVRALGPAAKMSRDHRPAPPDAVHRSILTGLISSIAKRTEEGTYRCARGREAVVFPGSAIAKKQPEWIMFNELVETSRLFARVVADIKPLWLEEVAPHLCRRQYTDPSFDEENGCVRAFERVTIFGLPIVERRQIHYDRVAPVEAREMFIREGLVAFRLRTHHRFLGHNRALVDEVRTLENKLRRRDLVVDDECIFGFYNRQLPHDAVSVHELNRCIRERQGDGFLRMNQGDVVAQEVDGADDYPDEVTVAGHSFPLVYSFDPASESDGITLVASAADAAFLGATQRGWLIPTLWREKVVHLLGTLPKATRRRLLPLDQTATLIAERLVAVDKQFEKEVARLAHELCGVTIDAKDFRAEQLPHYLSLHVASPSGSDAVAHRRETPPPSTPSIKDAFAVWGKRRITVWDFGDLDPQVPLSSVTHGIPLFGYPALKPLDGGVDLVLCPEEREGARLHPTGVQRLMEIVLEKDLDWLNRQLKFPKSLRLLCAGCGGEAEWHAVLLRLIREESLDPGNPPARTFAAFDRQVTAARTVLGSAAHRALVVLEEVLAAHGQARVTIAKMAARGTPALREDITSDVNGLLDLLRSSWGSLALLHNAPRYLRALHIRVERAFGQPSKYREKAAVLERYRARLREVAPDLTRLPLHHQRRVRELATMIEELAISLFAQQEVRTLYPVSEKRLDKAFDETQDAIEQTAVYG